VIFLENKNIIITGLILGIACFFIGAMISNVFPSSSEDLTSYKITAAIKLLGMGFFTTTLVLGGIINYEIDKNLKFLLLLLGLMLLMIYLIGSPMLRWDVSESRGLYDYGSDEESEIYNRRPTALGTPGFEFILAIISIIVLLFYKRYKSNI
jgi:hypothetical protein